MTQFQAEFLILVERARHNDDGTMDFYGVHNHVVSDVFPVVTPGLSYVLSLVGEPSEQVRLTAHVYDGLTEIARTDEFVVELNRIGQSIRLYNIDTVRFEHPGAYQLAIKSGGMVVAHTQFTLMHERDV